MGRGQRACLRAAALLASVTYRAYAMGGNAPGTTGLLEAAVGGKRTLVLADWPQIQDSHSMFFSALKVRETPSCVACYPVLTAVVFESANKNEPMAHCSPSLHRSVVQCLRESGANRAQLPPCG